MLVEETLLPDVLQEFLPIREAGLQQQIGRSTMDRVFTDNTQFWICGTLGRAGSESSIHHGDVS